MGGSFCARGASAANATVRIPAGPSRAVVNVGLLKRPTGPNWAADVWRLPWRRIGSGAEAAVRSTAHGFRQFVGDQPIGEMLNPW